MIVYSGQMAIKDIYNELNPGLTTNYRLRAVKDLSNNPLPWYNFYIDTANPPKNPGVGNLYFISPIYFGNSTEGWRAELEGIYIVPNVGSNLIHLDEIQVGTDKYKIIHHGTPGSYYPFPINQKYAIKILG